MEKLIDLLTDQMELDLQTLIDTIKSHNAI